MAGLGKCLFVAAHHDVQVVVAGPYLASGVQFAQFFFQLLRFVGSHHAGVVHEFGGDAQFGELAFAGAVAQGEAEDVVLGIGRVVEFGAVVKWFDLHVAKVDELFFYLSDGHVFELHGVERLFAYGWLDGFVAGLLNFLGFLGFALFDVEGQVVVVQVLLDDAFDVVGGDGHDFVFVVEDACQVFFVDEGVHQEVSFKGIRLHLYVEVAAHVHFDGFDLPVGKLSVGDLADGFQGFFLGAFVGFETALVFIVQGYALDEVAALFAHGQGHGGAVGQFAVEGQFVQGAGVAAVAQQGHGYFEGNFVGMSGGYTFIY